MNFSQNSYDPIESIIFEGGLRIVGVHCYADLDMVVYILNNKKVLTGKISPWKLLSQATPEQLENYELIGGGVGVHWPDVDEDLSLKGLLKEELARTAQFA